MVERYRPLFETGDRHGDLPGRTRRIAALNGTIDQWFLRIVQHGHILCPSFFGADSRKEIWIESGSRSKSQNFAIIRIQSDQHTATGGRRTQLLFGYKLQVEVDCGD